MSYGASIINFDRFTDTPDIRAKAMANAETGGPNSGFEIEGVEFFKQPELTDKFPEMADDISLIVSVESYVQRLVDFDRRIRIAKGMSRGMAVEFNELIPDLQSFSPSHFTVDISGIGVEASLEEISIKIWAIIAAASAFVLAAIYKFFSWMFGGGDANKGSGEGTPAEGEKGIKEAAKNLKEQAKVITEVEHVVAKIQDQKIDVPVPSYVDHGEIERSRMPAPLKDAIIKGTKNLGSKIGEPITYEGKVTINMHDVLMNIEGGEHIYQNLTNPSPYARIIYGENTPAMKFLDASFTAFGQIAQVTAGQIDLLKDMMEGLEDGREPAEADNLMRFAGQLKTLTEAPTIGEFEVGGRKFNSAINWAYELRQTVLDSSNYRHAFVNLEDMMDSYNRGFFRLSDVNFELLTGLFQILHDSKPVLEKLELLAKAQSLRKDMGMLHGTQRNERAENIIMISKHMRQNMQALMEVFSTISRVYSEVSKNGRNIMKVLVHNAKAIVDIYHRFDQYAPGDLEIAYQNLKEAEEQWEKHPIRDRLLPETAWHRFEEVRISGLDDSHSITMHPDAAKGILSSLLKR